MRTAKRKDRPWQTDLHGLFFCSGDFLNGFVKILIEKNDGILYNNM